MMKSQSDHTTKAFSGALWMLSNLGGREVLAVILNIVLMRILVPEDFAAVALVSGAVVILNVVSQLGVSVALVQRTEIDDECLDSAFVLTGLLFISGAALLHALARSFAHYYNNPQLGPLVKIAAFTFVIRGLSSFYRSLLLRDLNFRAIAITEVFGTLVYGGIAIFIALSGYGAYSIMWGNLGSAFVILIMFMKLKFFIPRSWGSIKVMGSLLHFGFWITVGRILGQASGQFDRFLIGKVLTEQALGAYHQAQRLTTTLPNLITSMLDQVLLPIYSNAKNDPRMVERGYWKGLRFSTLLVVPVCILMGVCAEPLVWALFGEKWLYMVPLMRIFAIFGALQGMGGGVFASVIYAGGIPQLNPVVNGFRVIVLPLCVWFGSRWGVIGVAWGLVVFGIAGRLFNQWLLTHYFNYSFLRFFKTIGVPILANLGLLVSGIAMTTLITLSTTFRTMINLLLVGGVSTVVYVIFCYWLMPEDVHFIISQLRHLIERKTGTSAIKTQP